MMQKHRRWAGLVMVPPLALAFAAAEPVGAGVHGRGLDSETAHAAGASTAISPKAELARMTFRQRVGQLLMVGTPASHGSHAAASAIRKYHAGSLILTGNSNRSLAWNKKRNRKAQKLASEKATAGSPLYIAADQEGGNVQNLRGKGFSRMPTALKQGTWSETTIKKRATKWGKQLKRAGINLNLAPVMGTVNKSFAKKNKPIGALHREYGYTPHRVEMKGTAFANGMRTAGLQTSIKHFPGLGRVRENTDTSANVHDTVTTRHGSTVKPFKTGVKAGSQFVMISSAFYNKIDPPGHEHRGVFSKRIMHTMVRGDLGFKGVVISDDLGQAKQVQNVKVGRRAIDFVKAGGNMMVTVKPRQAKTITHALVAGAKRSPGFKKKVNASALKVLKAKHRAGLDPKYKPTSPPTAASRDKDHLAMFVRGRDRRLKQKSFRPGHGWSEWRSHGGRLTSAPTAASRDSDHLAVLVRGHDHRLKQKSYTRGHGWSKWRSHGGKLTSAPTAASRDSDHLAVLVRGHDHRLKQKSYTRGHGWSKWRSHGGKLTSAPTAASRDKNHLTVFVRGHDHRLKQKSYTRGHGWSKWRSHGGKLTSAPTAVSRDKNHLTVFVRGHDHRLKQKSYTRGHGWSKWRSVN